MKNVFDSNLNKLTDDSKHETTDDVYSHYATKESILKAVLNGNDVEALCGEIWLIGRDPEDYIICPNCENIFEEISE